MMKEPRNEKRNEDPKNRSIALPTYLWDIVDKDAKRCRRSAVKQVEAILIRYYNIESDVDLDAEALAKASDTALQKPQVKKAA